MIICPKCNTQIADDNATACPNCGTAFAINRNQNQNATTVNITTVPTAAPAEQDDTGAAVGFGILSWFVPLAGFILFFVWKNEYPKRAKACLIGALITTILSIVSTIIYVAFMVLMMVIPVLAI